MRASTLLAGLGVALLLVAAPLLERARAADDAGGFITDRGNRVLQLLRDEHGAEAARKQEFTQLVDSSFDVPKIARFVLGRYWTTASDDERRQFGDAFEHYMVNVYWSRFADYRGETFKVTGQSPGSGDDTIVTTQVNRASGQPPAKVDWSVTKDGGGFKIRDVSIEGVSQALTYRQEIGAVIERGGGGVAAAIDDLRKKANG